MSKLVFFSGGYASENDRLIYKTLDLITAPNPRALVIPSCYEYTEESYSEFCDYFGTRSWQKIRVLNLDHGHLRYQLTDMLDCDFIFLSGGNTFYFLYWLRKTKALRALKKYAASSGVLAGLSAGAILMTPHVHTAAMPEFDRDDNIVNIKRLSALKLVGFEFFPHYTHQGRYVRELKKYSQRSPYPLYACSDGSGIIYAHNELNFVGHCQVYYKGTTFCLNEHRL